MIKEMIKMKYEMNENIFEIFEEEFEILWTNSCGKSFAGSLCLYLFIIWKFQNRIFIWFFW
jgi:hypothetical protein